MAKEFTVTEITEYIYNLFKRDYVLNSVCIKGEVSNCKESSGHIFFTLKDDGATIPAVLFSSARFPGLKCKICDGMTVKATGYIGVYQQTGRYQLYCSMIEEDGLGSIYERFEVLKKKLFEKGLFDENHKKNIPRYISTLGVITAQNGAAIKDIITVAQRRNPHIKIVLYPASVQGNGAAATLIAGIKAMEKIRPDVIIIGRGGGSAEDLFCFNDEALAYAAYNCTIPLISAVGHEIDYTIIDFVADRRAATPSAAAELAVYEYSVFRSELIDRHSVILNTMLRKIEQAEKRTANYELALKNYSPKKRLDNYILRTVGFLDSLTGLFMQKINNCRLKTDGYGNSVYECFHKKLTLSRHRTELLKARLEGISPEKSLERGYSYITDDKGHNITSKKQVTSGQKINIRTGDGSYSATTI